MTNPVLKPLCAAAIGQRPARTPLWFMRQAGRYLPEYRAIRAQTDFLGLCRNPKLAAEVTLQPLRRFDLDAAIIFSDILIPPTAMGQTLTFDQGEGPVLDPVIRSAADLKRLVRPDVTRDLGYLAEAITLTKAGLGPAQAMIGFAGAPFTVASYMIEGRGSRNFTEVKRLLLRDPATFSGLLELLAEVSLDYLKMQIQAGADIIMIFDTWAGQLTGPDYREHVLPVTARLIRQVKAMKVPVIYYPGQGSDKMHELAGLEVDVISVDWRTRIGKAVEILRAQGLDVTVQGNLDPQWLLADEARLRTAVRAILTEGQAARAHIFNVGHGLLPHTPPEAVAVAIDEARRFKA